MKSIQNILLFLIIFEVGLPKGTFDDIMHISDLAAHFREHKIENKQISLLEFIEEHSGNPNHEHKNKHAHDHLPFNHSHQLVDHGQVWNVVILESDCAQKKRNSTTLKTTFQQSCYYSNYLQKVWQPPNVA